MNGEGKIVRLEQPLITLGDRAYVIDRPLVSTLLTARVDGDPQIDDLQPGVDFDLVPGDDDDDTVVTAAVADWTPGSISLFDD